MTTTRPADVGAYTPPAAPPRRAPGEAAARHARGRVLLALVALVLLAVARSAWGTRLDGLTIDEPWHVVAGVEYVRTGNFRLNPEHPPLVKLVVGALAPAGFVLRPVAALSEKSAERDMVEETFFLENDFTRAHQAARRAMWLLNGLLLLAFGALLWRALGAAWAMGALAFLAIDPTVAAHMPVVMTDLPVALTLGIAAAGMGLTVSTWQWRWAVVAGIGMGLALAAKHSALPGVAGLGLAAAVVAVVQHVRLRASAGAPAPASHPPATSAGLALRLAMLGAVAGIAIALLWASYGLHFHAAPDGTDPFNRSMADKIGDLHGAGWKALLAFCDRWTLLPRAYLWGLADTVRAGVEGRGQNVNLLWGRFVFGAPPWYTWPSFLLVKLPLALLALAALGLATLGRVSWTRMARWTLAAVVVVATVHLLALVRSQGTYAGVRHALPVVVALAVLGGAAVHVAVRRRSRALGAATGLALLAALGTTLAEPRAWEYHNALVGGSAGAALQFGNEGLDLGQRALEIARFAASREDRTAPLYSGYDFPEEYAKALGLNYARRAATLADTNVAGIYEGYFVYTRASHVPAPQYDYDPAEVFAGLERVAQLGFVEVWRGRQVRPKARAGSMMGRVMDHVYKERGTEWALVAQRSEEVLAVLPFRLDAAIEAGNAYVRLGRREDALRAYRQPLAAENNRGTLSDVIRRDLLAHIARIEGGAPLATLPPLRNPWME